MKCSQCNLIYNNLTGVCPRCGETYDGGQWVPFFDRPIIKSPAVSVSLLQVLLVASINISLLLLLVNIILKTRIGGEGVAAWWSLFAILPIVVGYFICSFLAAGKNNVLRKFRWFSRILTILMLLIQLLVFPDNTVIFDYYFAAQFFAMAIALIIIILTQKLSWTRAYFTVLSLSATGIFPFIVTVCGVTSGHLAAYVINLTALLLAVALIFNLGLYCVLSIKAKASKIL